MPRSSQGPASSASWCAADRAPDISSPRSAGAKRAPDPIAYAYPVEGDLPVITVSTSVVPEGVIRSLKHRGIRAADGALRDAKGDPTNDPAALYADPRGAIQPLGGAFGYRGTALGMLVDVLAALLADDDADDITRAGSNLAMLAIATDQKFPARARRMGDYIRTSPPLDDARPVMLPGERELREARRAADGPISVDAPTWAALVKIAGDGLSPTPVG